MQIGDFTQTEAELFRLRLAHKTLDECAEAMDRSTDSVKQISRRVNDKIRREM